ncbi:hypothetical protein VULLAG_LOCUS12376 [Vulpes lagopus]
MPPAQQMELCHVSQSAQSSALETPVDPPPPTHTPRAYLDQVRQVKHLPGNGAGAPHLPGPVCSDRIQRFQASSLPQEPAVTAEAM